MADGEYRRLCSIAECGGKHKAHGYCLRHYRQHQRGGIKADAERCAQCGGDISGQIGKIYCSRRCKLVAWRQANPDMAAEHRRTAHARRPQSCAYFVGFCVECGQPWGSRGWRERCEACQAARSKAAEASRYTPVVRTCKCCGLHWTALAPMGPAGYCPTEGCQEARRSAKRAARQIEKRRSGRSHLSRAKKLGRKRRKFNPIRVFERDGWRCQLCGSKTPSALRGTTNSKAPELDHIVPLAAGGDHVPENCQCACRACNIAKGARPLGQLLLIG